MKQVIKCGFFLLLPLMLILLTASYCNEELKKFEYVKLINQSGEKIYLGYISYDKEHKPIDVQFIFSNFRLDYNNFKIIESKASNFELCVQEGECLSIAIFKECTFAKYSVHELIETNYCDKYYDYSFDELKAMNFTITYTGE